MADEELQPLEPIEQVQETPVVETPELKPADQKPAEPLPLRDQIKKSMEAVNAKAAEKVRPQTEQPGDGRIRDPATGQFKPKDQQAAPDKVEQPKSDVKPQLEAKPGTEQPKKADAAPGTWRAEAKADWDKTPATVKAETLRREADFSREVGKYQQQIQQINQTYGPIEQIIGPRRALWRASMGSEVEAIKRMVNLSDLASENPTDFLAYYLSQPNIASKVDLQRVFGAQAPAGGDISTHPVVKHLQETVNGLNQQVSGFIGQQNTQRVSSAEQQVSEFAQGKDAQGNLLRPHFEAVREDVFNLIPALRQQFPNSTPQQILDKAYTVAIRTNDMVSGEVQKAEEERILAQVEARERAKKAQLANKSVTTSSPPPNGQAGGVDPTDLRGTLVRNFRAMQRGESARV